jgi:hypothetical protein
MIEIRSFFGEWKEVTEEQAMKFIKTLKSGMLTSNKNEIINNRYLRGITVEELENKIGVKK